MPDPHNALETALRDIKDIIEGGTSIAIIATNPRAKPMMALVRQVLLRYRAALGARTKHPYNWERGQ